VETRAALDAATAALRATLPERRAVRRYQSDDGTAARLNALLRRRPAFLAEVPRLAAIAATLDGLLVRAQLPVDLTVYRGVADARPLLDPRRPLPSVELQRAYVSTTLDRDEAVDGFVGRSTPGALLEIAVPAGSCGVWLPPLGREELADEQEVLLARKTPLMVRTRSWVGGILVVECEVIP
jgi:hypothetical protein